MDTSRPPQATQHPSAPAEMTAEQWFAINLDAAAAAQRAAEFEAWLQQAGHAEAYQRVQEVWNTVGRYVGSPELDELTRQALTDTDPDRPLPPRRWLFTGAASVLVLLGVAAVAAPLLNDASSERADGRAKAVTARASSHWPGTPTLSASEIQWGARDPSAADWR